MPAILPRRAATSSVFGGLRRHRALLDLGRGRLAAICTTGVGAGVLQAGLLLVIVQAAAAVTSGSRTISLEIPPLPSAVWSIDTVLLIGTAALVLLLGLELTNSALQAHLTARSVASTRKAMLAAYSVADYAEKTRHERGETSQLVFGMPGSALGISGAIATLLTGISNFGTLVVSAIVISPVATGTSLLGFIVILVLLRPLARATQRLSDARSTEQRVLGSRQLERLELAAEISAFGVADHVDAGIDRGIDRIEVFTRRIRFVGRASSVVYRIGVFAMILGMLAVLSRMADPDLATLTASMLLLLRSLSYGQSAQQAYQTMAEVMPVIDQLAAARDSWLASAGEPSAEVASGRWRPDAPVRFDRVSFAYDDVDVLCEVTAEIAPGEFVAVVGPSGSGKSTFLQLLLRLRAPGSGWVTVGDSPIQTVDMNDWRRSVAYVPQTPRLLSGTVRDAIRFGRDISDAALRTAAERANIADEIERWPAGWDTELRDVGETLSGGQRQRLSLARALADDPSILLLDEPTSALDPDSERMVTATLAGLKGDVTIVTIAHRLGTIRCADRVIVFDAGTARTVGIDALDIRDTTKAIAA